MHLVEVELLADVGRLDAIGAEPRMPCTAVRAKEAPSAALSRQIQPRVLSPTSITAWRTRS